MIFSKLANYMKEKQRKKAELERVLDFVDQDLKKHPEKLAKNMFKDSDFQPETHYLPFCIVGDNSRQSINTYNRTS